MLFEIDTLLLVGAIMLTALALAFAVRPIIRPRDRRSPGKTVGVKGE
jgi:flagellar biosynthesis/type III secretory pathway M-ring protein FliF/YscJ